MTEDYKRVYNDAVYFAPIIGYTGKVSEDELKDLQQKDSSYDSTDVVGKVGLEKEMETSLQGKKGSETIYVDNLGRTLSATRFWRNTSPALSGRTLSTRNPSIRNTSRPLTRSESRSTTCIIPCSRTMC